MMMKINLLDIHQLFRYKYSTVIHKIYPWWFQSGAVKNLSWVKAAHPDAGKSGFQCSMDAALEKCSAEKCIFLIIWGGVFLHRC